MLLSPRVNCTFSCLTYKLRRYWVWIQKDISSLFCRTPCCGPIHGLHLCDNFGALNINIEDFIGKKNEKFHKYYPFLYKSQDPQKLNWSYLPNRVEFWHSIKCVKNHSNEFYKMWNIFLTPPIALTFTKFKTLTDILGSVIALITYKSCNFECCHTFEFSVFQILLFLSLKFGKIGEEKHLIVCSIQDFLLSPM